MACLGGLGIAVMGQSCSSVKSLSGTIVGDELVLPASDFEVRNNGQVFFKKYVVVQNDLLKYPICVYRISESEYSALWMRCTHQGAELQVFGEKLQCPAHGSEFDRNGVVQSGPAELNLRTFNVSPVEKQLRISLKAES